MKGAATDRSRAYSLKKTGSINNIEDKPLGSIIKTEYIDRTHKTKKSRHPSDL